MKTDGKILEYKTPNKVEQVLKKFSGHAIYDSLPFLQNLHPNTKKVRFSDLEVQESRVVRVKIVISKKELHDMLQKEGISVEKMLSKVHNEKVIDSDNEDLSKRTCDIFQGWKPALETIAEIFIKYMHMNGL
ncbi:PREDICTED: uncharacterized protein LOC109347104 [Lupinus angustifolius]|uniref:uncharacterized protein LOC109347104 n=1 Tax=Lupinus angustifolius TaxID=3871 RepID=UPI00092EA712|nr:PREDICTED: uncharacterized protein LOC109347104 [Lupinus angustifolius]